MIDPIALLVVVMLVQIALAARVWIFSRDKPEKRKRKNDDAPVTYLSNGLATPDIIRIYREDQERNRVSDQVPDERPVPFSTSRSKR